MLRIILLLYRLVWNDEVEKRGREVGFKERVMSPVRDVATVRYLQDTQAHGWPVDDVHSGGFPGDTAVKNMPTV